MRVIGTAGHVDHGKSTLVEKLSGIHPDRLAEEQSRQMTIDLGFAWLDLPDGETVGIVDVPGHRDFIENMLAGVGGIDAALLVIAADEGIMPQTREHLSILKLLEIERVIVVISKIDLVDDPEWLELIELEIDDLLAASGLDGTPIVPLSAMTGAGLNDLLDLMRETLAKLPPRDGRQHPRLPIDRVFTVSGFGAVVTGTLSGGRLALGDVVELQPRGARGRVRGLQSYKRAVDVAAPGSRVAVNVAGLNSGDARRGDVLTLPGLVQPTLLADARIRLLADASRLLPHGAEVKVFVGAAEAMARVRLLDADALAPGESGWLQLRLREPMPLASGDRFILRFPSPPETVGGGAIVNPNPGRRRKRFQPQVMRDLDLQLNGKPSQRLALAARGDAPAGLEELRTRLGFSHADLSRALDEALGSGLARRLDDRSLLAEESWQRLARALATELSAFHQEHPLRLGMPRAELRSRLRVQAGLLDQIIEADERFARAGQLVRLAEHRISYADEQRRKVDELLRALAATPYTPPTIAEMNRLAGEDLVRSLLDQRVLAQVNDSIAFSAEAYDALVAEVRRCLAERGEIDAKTLRDKFGTSRKYAIPVLEHLDSLGITQRVGDVRRAGRNA